MASHKERFSSGSSSLRQSLGMPLRSMGRAVDSQEWQQPGSNVAMVSGPRPSTGHHNSQKQQQQYVRRKTYTTNNSTHGGKSSGFGVSQQRHVGSSRPSAGRSSIYGSSQVKKDPRQLFDKSFQVSVIKKLIKFLASKNYPATLTVKSLQTPTCREFLHIFNFLLELIDESLTVDGMNIVEEVPLMLKMLGYPFNVSRNHLLNVGSPHSWPILLGALSWLIECCSVPDNTSHLMFSREDDFEDDSDDRMEIQYKVEEIMYSTYMYHGENSDQYQELVAGRIEASRNECAQYESECEVLRQENEELIGTIGELQKSSLSVLQDKVQQNHNDYETLQHHLDNEVISVIKTVENMKARLHEDASEVEVQIEASKEKIHELEEQIRRQPISSSDAHDLHQGIKDAEDMLDKKRTQHDEGLKRIFELQIQHNKSVQLIDSQSQEGNSKLHRLSAIHPDVVSLNPLNYDTSRRADLEVLQNLLAHAKFLREELQKLYQGVAESILDCENKALAAESNHSTLHTALVRKELEIADLQHTMSITKEDIDQKRKLNEETMKTEMAEKLALEKHFLALQKRLQEESTAEKNFLTTQKQYEASIADMASEVKDKNDMLKELVIKITKFIEALQEHQHGIRSNVAELVKQFNDVKIPTVHPEFLIPFQP